MLSKLSSVHTHLQFICQKEGHQFSDNHRKCSCWNTCLLAANIAFLEGQDSKQSCGKICSEKLSHLTFIRMQTIVKFKYKIDPDFFLNFSICFTFKPDLAKCQASVSHVLKVKVSKLKAPAPSYCMSRQDTFVSVASVLLPAASHCIPPPNYRGQTQTVSSFITMFV